MIKYLLRIIISPIVFVYLVFWQVLNTIFIFLAWLFDSTYDHKAAIKVLGDHLDFLKHK